MDSKSPDRPQAGVESDSRGPWMQTYPTARAVHLLDVTDEEISLDDLAHALSLICRYDGHVREHYSVAQHCVAVSFCVEAMISHDAMPPGEDAPAGYWRAVHAKAGLIHDAHEAYSGDMTGPMKQALRAVAKAQGRARSDFDVVEEMHEAAVHRRFGVPRLGYGKVGAIGDMVLPRNVKRADLILLATEKRDLKGDEPKVWESLDGIEPLPSKLKPWSADMAKLMFLSRAADLGLR